MSCAAFTQCTLAVRAHPRFFNSPLSPFFILNTPVTSALTHCTLAVPTRPCLPRALPPSLEQHCLRFLSLKCGVETLFLRRLMSFFFVYLCWRRRGDTWRRKTTGLWHQRTWRLHRTAWTLPTLGSRGYMHIFMRKREKNRESERARERDSVRGRERKRKRARKRESAREKEREREGTQPLLREPNLSS